MDEVVADFVAESRENLDRVEADLIELEKDPKQPARIGSIFRAIHTVKGTCGFLDLHQLESVAHAGENLLAILRDGKLAFDTNHATAMLSLVDAIRTMIGHVELTGKDGNEPYPQLVAHLNALATTEPGAPIASEAQSSAASAMPSEAAPVPPATPIVESLPAPLLEPDHPHAAAPSAAPPAETASDQGDAKVVLKRKPRHFGKSKAGTPPATAPIPSRRPPPSAAEPAPEPKVAAVPEVAALAPAAVEPLRPNAVLAEVPRAAAPLPAPPEAPPPPEAPRAAPPGDVPPPNRATTIRVDVAVLDRLMNLVGELVLARNQLLELTAQEVRSALALTSQRINQVTSDLQNSVMKTRMQPISTVWNKFPRVARELAVQCGKRIVVDLEGSETELDKTVLEAISEPLSHLVRNSVDHGIEAPAVRVAAGKPAEGRIKLSASHQAGHVIIDIADDGAGINVARVKQKAIEKGIISEAQAQRLSAAESIKLIFAPGFSTAERVTNISGRGVGMDVVRTNIERIGGSVDMFNADTGGAVCRVRLPLTLAIVPAIIVSTAGQRFAMPQLGLQELVRLREGGGSVEHVHGAPVYRLRGNLLPLIWLAESLGLQKPSLTEKLGSSGHVLVVQVQDASFGIVVDEVNNSEEIVVKPLCELISGVDVYAGTTILGDGEVALILDAGNLVAHARVADAKVPREAAEQAIMMGAQHEARRYVLCEMSAEARVAVPLEQVERLEKLQRRSVESRRGRAAIQYRGQVMRLLSLEDGSNGVHDVTGLADSNDLVHTLVYRAGALCLGLVVPRILDVVELNEEQRRGADTAVLDGRLTTLVDLGRAVSTLASPSLLPPPDDLEEAS